MLKDSDSFQMRSRFFSVQLETRDEHSGFCFENIIRDSALNICGVLLNIHGALLNIHGALWGVYGALFKRAV